MAGCGSPLSALDCGRHCFCGVWDAVAGSQAGPRGGAPRSVPCVAGYRTGTCRATLLDPRGPSEGRLRGSLDRACGFHTPPPGNGDPGRPREETGRAGQAQPMPRMPTRPAQRTPGLGPGPQSPEMLARWQGMARKPTPRPRLRAGWARRCPRSTLLEAGCPPVQWGWTGAPVWTGSFSYPFQREEGPPTLLACSLPPAPRPVRTAGQTHRARVRGTRPRHRTGAPPGRHVAEIRIICGDLESAF